ncbi:MAG: hypothetical protein ACPG4X_14570 [Pikeienuella sp.]
MPAQWSQWSPEEDEILTRLWKDPQANIEDIIRLLPVPRTDGAVKYHAGMIGLGKKARVPGAVRKRVAYEPWPDDMPQFEDHPDAAAPSSGANAAKRGARYRQASDYPAPSIEAEKHGDGARRIGSGIV